jgi:signal transduction histidine kinase/ActR/RegA family two-component response regulator
MYVPAVDRERDHDGGVTKDAPATDARFEKLASLLTDVVWTADAHGAFVACQSSWQAYTGQTWSAHRGFGWLDAIHPEERGSLMARWARAAHSPEIWEMAGRIWHAASNGWRRFAARATPLFADGGVIREWVGAFVDVDQRQLVETERTALVARAEHERARLYQLFSQAPAHVWIARAPDLVVEFANDAVRHALGRDIVGMSLREGDDPAYLASVEQVLATGDRVTATELPVNADWESRGDVHERWFNFVHEPMRAEDGTLEGVMSFGFDVTDLVRARKRVEGVVLELEAASRAKDEFLATVSHELRTPLSSIMGWSSLLVEHPSDTAMVAKGGDIIHRNAKTQAKLIEDILDVSRIVTGKLRLDARPVDIGSIVRDAVEVLRPAATAKRIDVDVDLAPDLPCVVGDDERLRQIVWNLVSNAVKFTDEGGGRVTVRAAKAAHGVMLEVSDTGPGIPEDFLPHVFERFRQADTSTTRTQRGRGRGHAIVRSLVELHGGTVTVRSDGPGQGATFTVRLPAHDDDAGASRDEEHRTPAGLRGLHVLVVDDEDDVREMLAHALETWGARVTTADGVSPALSALQHELPDVVVGDIGMPGQDGYALIAEIRSLEGPAAGLPVIALTAWARATDAQRAIDCGFDYHVAKPIDPEDLRSVVARAATRKLTTEATRARSH